MNLVFQTTSVSWKYLKFFDCFNFKTFQELGIWSSKKQNVEYIFGLLLMWLYYPCLADFCWREFPTRITHEHFQMPKILWEFHIKQLTEPLFFVYLQPTPHTSTPPLCRNPRNYFQLTLLPCAPQGCGTFRVAQVDGDATTRQVWQQQKMPTTRCQMQRAHTITCLEQQWLFVVELTQPWHDDNFRYHWLVHITRDVPSKRPFWLGQVLGIFPYLKRYDWSTRDIYIRYIRTFF